VIAWAAGAEVRVGDTDLSEQPNAFQVFPPAILFAVMAWGMWRARYWAVLGFEAIMAILMVGSVITLIAATDAFKAITSALVLVGAGTLFWLTVKALARIQMPEPSRR
jgi:threonine/homoserine/homoserine lactone efflux protein